ncbi:DUF1294 domain-containing protein [Clostridia bacterium OttesenSCG-928-F22]|nr:DUF1294 domain-containing protein [Clostridia bacterium OttesenSCG-928-F22]
MVYVLYYLAFINAIAFVLCGADKRKARKHKRRISERTLLLVSFIGGAAGFYVAMLLFRHKTRHRKFSIGVPVMLVVQAAVITYLTIIKAA